MLRHFLFLSAAIQLLMVGACAKQSDSDNTGANDEFIVGVMPKLVGIEYFNACEVGAMEAGKELGVTVKYDGPPTNDVAAQAQMVETWIARGYDAITIAPNDPDRIAPALKKARDKGIAVLTYDADAAPDARDFFINQATYADIAKTLVDIMAEGIGDDGKFVILTGSLTAANQNIWIAEMLKYQKIKYPKMVNLRDTPLASEEDQAKATQVTIDALKASADIQGIFAMTSVALPGAAEGLRKAGAAGKVFLTGLSTPKTMRQYVEDGTVKKVVLWSPVDLGYLTVHAAKLFKEGKLKEGTIDAGRLGAINVVGDEVLLGPPMVFDAENIADFDF
jgi:ABC-type sugar transport system substrate-binding protein